MLHKILSEYASCAVPGGAMLASYWAADGPKAYPVEGPVGDEMARDDWGFIKVVKFSFAYLESAAAEHGLVIEEVMLDRPRLAYQIRVKISLPAPEEQAVAARPEIKKARQHEIRAGLQPGRAAETRIQNAALRWPALKRIFWDRVRARGRSDSA